MLTMPQSLADSFCQRLIPRNVVECDIMLPYSNKGLTIKMLPYSNTFFHLFIYVQLIVSLLHTTYSRKGMVVVWYSEYSQYVAATNGNSMTYYICYNVCFS